jgi:hypothetical protein
MSSQAKNYAIALLACTTLGAGAYALHTRQRLADALQAPSLQVTRSEFTTAAAPAPIVAPAPAPAAPAPEAREIEAIAERMEAGPGEGGPGQRGQRGGGQFAAQMAALMEDPEFTAAWKIQQEARIERRYGALFKDLNLPPDQLASLKTLLAERENVAREVWATAPSQGINPREDRDQIRALTAELQAEVDANIKNTVGPNVLEAIGDYDRTTAPRVTVNDLVPVLQNSGNPLNESQTKQLTKILAETGQQQGRTTLITDATLTSAAGILTNAQLEQLKAQQEVQKANILIEAKMRAARDAARANRPNRD